MIQTETDVSNCQQGTPTLVYTSAGVPVASPQLGDYAEVTPTCDFTLVTPLAGLLFGDPITMDAESTLRFELAASTAPAGQVRHRRHLRSSAGQSRYSPTCQSPVRDLLGNRQGSSAPLSGRLQDSETGAAAVVTPTDPACVHRSRSSPPR